MWHDTHDKPLPTYGMNGRSFILGLRYRNYYGHETSKRSEVVVGVWDSVCECFFEAKTNKEIDSREIVQWYEK